MNIQAVRKSLGLTQAELAGVLDMDPRTVRAVESPPGTSQHRSPPVRMVRLMQAYIDGYRPKDWPV